MHINGNFLRERDFFSIFLLFFPRIDQINNNLMAKYKRMLAVCRVRSVREQRGNDGCLLARAYIVLLSNYRYDDTDNDK